MEAWLVLVVVLMAAVVFAGLGLKRRLVRAVGTAMTFPQARPEQFPKLDRDGLDRFSSEMEGLGFEKLFDASPTMDAPTSAPTFCRIYAHRDHHCYGAIMQPFPVVGPAVELRSMVNGYLDDGWSVGFGNGKPLAASTFVRTPRAIGVNVPAASPSELLAGFLEFRQRVCGDLGLRPIPDTSLEHYVRRTNEQIQAIREAMKKKNIAVGMGQYWSRAAGSGRTTPQEAWLGDYPRLAEERRAAGLGPGFTGGGDAGMTVRP